MTTEHDRQQAIKDPDPQSEEPQRKKHVWVDEGSGMRCLTCGAYSIGVDPDDFPINDPDPQPADASEREIGDWLRETLIESAADWKAEVDGNPKLMEIHDYFTWLTDAVIEQLEMQDWYPAAGFRRQSSVPTRGMTPEEVEQVVISRKHSTTLGALRTLIGVTIIHEPDAPVVEPEPAGEADVSRDGRPMNRRAFEQMRDILRGSMPLANEEDLIEAAEHLAVFGFVLATASNDQRTAAVQTGKGERSG